MKQTNTDTGFVRRIRREGHKIAMFFDRYWTPFDKKTSDAICFAKAMGTTSPLVISIRGNSYAIDVVEMTQTNTKSGTVRDICII